MTQLTTPQAFALALQHHQAGRLRDAEQIYRQILAQQPAHAGALHYLGLIAHQMGRHDVAVDLIRQAIALRPGYAEAHNNLGIALKDKGQLDEAIAAYRQAITLRSGYAEAHNNLGNALRDKGQLDDAIAAYRQAIALQPPLADAHCNLGNALKDRGQLDEAVAAYQQAIALRPDYAQAHNNLGNALKDMGRLDEATATYRQAIALNPSFAEAQSNLGVALQEKGLPDEAIMVLRQAIALRPGYAEAHYNLGNALQDKKQLDAAIAAYRQAITLKPAYAQAHNNLGNALEERGQLDEAIASYQQATALGPGFAEAHNNLGNALRAKGQLDEAIISFRRAITLRPAYVEAHSNLGNALKDTGQLDEAIAAHRQAIALRPGFAGTHSNLGNALKDRGQLDEAIAAYQRAITLTPGLAEAHNNLGNALRAKGQPDAAIVSFRHAITLRPDYVEAHSNLGSALKDKGQLDEAIAADQQAITLRPDFAGVHSNLVFTLHYHPGQTAEMIRDEERRWNRQHAEPLKAFIQPRSTGSGQAHANDRNPDRRLRIGYVSPDFNRHPVGRFLLPLLAHHNKAGFEVFAYAQVPVPDVMTERLRACTDAWRSIVGLGDAQVADLILADRIDILVDLTLHAAHNRLLVFARKPAPVQVSWLGYPGSTGLETIDYRLSDPYLDPVGIDESVYSEQTIRLPETYWCYEQTADAPKVAPLPALQRGQITFGCLNNICKVSEPVLMTWCKLLQAAPNSRLLLHAYEGSHRRQIQERMNSHGIDPSRIQFVGRLPLQDYFRLYHQIDIALDTFPYGGGTTTCDALWMGVPVVSLVGATAVGRGGLSILSNIGLPELTARSQEEYVRIANGLANDIPRLSDLRSTLRQRMECSPLMDAPKFARNIESAYRQMWRSWCGEEMMNYER